MEQAHNQPSFEAPPPSPVRQGELLPVQGHEYQPGPAARPESIGEIRRAPAPVQQPQQDQQLTVQPQPAPQQPVVDFQQQAQIISSRAPQDAADSDVIEPVWIKYIKKTIQKNRDDPFAQAQEMSYLQADYLKKRFAKELRVPKD